jgi:hypothetical protein
MIRQGGLLVYTGINVDGGGGSVTINTFTQSDAFGDRFGKGPLGQNIPPPGIIKPYFWAVQVDDFPSATANIGRLRWGVNIGTSPDGAHLTTYEVTLVNDNAIGETLKMVAFVGLTHTMTGG